PFHDPSPTLTFTLSLHDALPIYAAAVVHTDGRPVPARLLRRAPDREELHVYDGRGQPLRPLLLAPDRQQPRRGALGHGARRGRRDRKSTRLNSSHVSISYAVFCL